jgi:hypothetical protein
MTIYFAFSDESGNYKQDRNIQFNQNNPFYIRASFLMLGDEWLYLDYLFRELKLEFGLSPQTEIKYSDVWTLFNYQRNNTRRLENRLVPLKDYPTEGLVDFIGRSLNLLQELECAKIIVTITKNGDIGTISERFVYTTHIQNLMQRIQKEFEDDNNPQTNENLCLIFIDPVGPQINNLLTNSYNELYLNGDYFNQYFTIKDCLHFELSHHSSGIQLADFIAGVTNGYLKGREDSIEIFNQCVRPFLRQDTNGKITGWGIIEIPTNKKVRKYLTDNFHVT